MYNHEEKVIKNEIKEMSKNKKMQPGFFFYLLLAQYHNITISQYTETIRR